jgi:hypothetical protein
MSTKRKPPGRPFTKGDPRINKKGRPKSFDALRSLAVEIAHEVAMSGDAPIVINGHKVTVAEVIMRKWAASGDPQLQRGFVEIAFGKVPSEVQVTGRADAAIPIAVVQPGYLSMLKNESDNS